MGLVKLKPIWQLQSLCSQPNALVLVVKCFKLSSYA